MQNFADWQTLIHHSAMYCTLRARTLEIDYDWEEFSAIKKWKKSLAKKSIKGELSQSTWKSSRYWMKKLLTSSGLNPDQLVSEALESPEHGEDRSVSARDVSSNHSLYPIETKSSKGLRL